MTVSDFVRKFKKLGRVEMVRLGAGRVEMVRLWY
jgi:hypothetical protein